MRVITKTRNLSLITALAVILTISYIAFVSKPAYALAIEVNSIADTTADDGVCTLREAIISSNTDTASGASPGECAAGSGVDTITFNISGSGVHTITPATALPTITEQVTIDGYSQTGATENTAVAPLPMDSVIKIEVDFINANDQDHGMLISADDSIIKGLSVFGKKIKEINPNDSGAISVNAANVLISGCYIGVVASGQVVSTANVDTLQPSVFITDAATNTMVGSETAADRNILGSAGDFSLGDTGTATILYGNYVGLARDGISDLNSNSGLNLKGPNTIIGGVEATKKNVLSGNALTQITIAQSPTTVGNNINIQGNIFGTNYNGEITQALSNGAGVSVSTSCYNILIGGTGIGEGNTFLDLSGTAIGVVDYTIAAIPLTLSPNKVTILGNIISETTPYEYFGPSFGDTNLGIDILRSIQTTGFGGVPDAFTDQGPNTNDTGDSDTGPNGFINTPVLKSAKQVGNQLTITYDLDADDAEEPANLYRIEFFSNSESTIFGVGPGETYLGSATVTPGTDKSVTLTVSGDQTNKALSSTTTAVDTTTTSGFGSTSEFSQNISIGSATDFDADGSSDSIEDGAPNGGDGNNDGTLDSLQPTVTSFLDHDGSHYITLVTEGCSENGTVSSLDYLSITNKDNGYLYPHGLIDFTLNCSRGDTVDVTIFTHDESAQDAYSSRKYNPNTGTYDNIPGSTLSNVTIDGNSVLKLEYSITDGGPLDDDGEENGVIVDPVGLAVEGVTTTTGSSPGGDLADTGSNHSQVNLVSIVIISFSLIGMLKEFKLQKF